MEEAAPPADPDGNERDDVRAAQAGDLEAYGRLVERHQEVAFRAAWLIVRDAAAAQDVCQEGFPRAQRHLGRFRVGEPFRPWLLRVVTNLAKNHVRARSRRRGIFDRLLRQPQPVAPPPALAIEAAEREVRVHDALTRLSVDDREVIELRYFLELSEAEMASVLSVRPGTVKSRLSRARSRLRAVIEERYPDLAAIEARYEASQDA